ncbi:MAG: ABC transporter ATP-binding protein, partial [Anaerolineales bacterium]
KASPRIAHGFPSVQTIMRDGQQPVFRQSRRAGKASRPNPRKLFLDGLWAFKYSFSRNTGTLLQLWLLAGLQSALPVAIALSTRGMVNAVIAVHSGSAGGDSEILLWLLAGLGAATLDALAGVAFANISVNFQDLTIHQVTVDILNHTAQLDLEQLEDVHFQDTLGLVQQNSGAAFGRFQVNLISLASGVLGSVFLLLLLYRIDPWTIPLVVPAAGLYVWFQWKYIGRKTAMERSRTTKRRWTRYFTTRAMRQEFIPEIKILDLAPLLHAKFDALMREFIRQDKSLRETGFRIQAFFSVITNSLVMVLLWRVIDGVRTGMLTIGDLTIFGSAALRLRQNLNATIQNLGNALESTIYITHLRLLLQITPLPRGSANRAPGACRGDFVLDNVSFTYPEASQPTLKNISLRIRSGEVIALIGENGAGKTTLVKLLTRLYSPSQGRVLLDGHDLEEYSADFLRRQYMFVFQNFGRYEGTVAENISYGDWRRLADHPEAIPEIARACGMDSMIQSLPNGYQTMLGRMFGEIDLSGGQWQRIAITRAFARRGSILILDEPTSNLDPRAEYEIFRQFQSLAAGRTTILISHRFSTVSMAHRIIVLEDGEIVEEGSHADLLRAGNLYATLYRMQKGDTDSPQTGRQRV